MNAGAEPKRAGVLALDPRPKLLLFLVTCMFVMGCTQMIPCLLMGTLLALLLALSGRPAAAAKYFAAYVLVVWLGTAAAPALHGALSIAVLAVSVLLRMMLPIFMAFTLVFQTTTIS